MNRVGSPADVTFDDVVAEAVTWGVRRTAARAAVVEVRDRSVDRHGSAELHRLSGPSSAWMAEHVAALPPPRAG